MQHLKTKPLFILTTCLLTLLTILGTQCINNGHIKRDILLHASREAPLGWVHLSIYKDSTFEFTLTGIRSADKRVYKGNTVIRNDSLFFQYSDSLPGSGQTAVFNERVVAYVDGQYPEKLNVIQTKLTAKK